eukprot:753913-Prymnesium_polylepis.2
MQNTEHRSLLLREVQSIGPGYSEPPAPPALPANEHTATGPQAVCGAAHQTRVRYGSPPAPRADSLARHSSPTSTSGGVGRGAHDPFWPQNERTSPRHTLGCQTSGSAHSTGRVPLP